MGGFAIELQGVPRGEQVGLLSVGIAHGPLEHVDEFGARMLERGEAIARLGQGDQQRLQAAMLAAEGTQLLVGMLVLGAVAIDEGAAS